MTDRRQLALLYRQIATMLDAGVDPGHALGVLGKQALKHWRPLMSSMSCQVYGGSRLSDAMDTNRAVFPASHAAVITAAEEAGETAHALWDLAAMLEEQAELHAEVRRE